MAIATAVSSPHIGLAAGICAALFLLFILLRPIFDPLRRIPGPSLARHTRLWLFKEVWFGTFPSTNVKLHKRYGPVVRIAPNEYSIDDPAAVKAIYGSGNGFVKSPWYSASGMPGNPLVNIFAEPDPHRHAGARRKIAAAYSMTSLVQMEPFVDDCSAVLKARLEQFAGSGTAIDVSHWMQCYAFDVIGKLTVGDRFGFLDSGEDIQGIMSSLSQWLTYCARMGIFPEWHKSLFHWLMGSNKMSGLLHIQRFAGKRLEEKYEKVLRPDGNPVDPMAPVDLITKLMRIQDESPEKIGKADIGSACMMNIGAGSDTTSISLSSVLFHLLKHPKTLGRLRDEIKDCEKRGEISEPAKFSETQRMPYLQAVIKEALRMHPATGLTLGRTVPPQGAVLAGHFFPGGTVVGINSWVAHSNQEIFGVDAGEFRPERWLAAPEMVKRLESYFMTFGQGSRTCIGKHISIMELSKAIPQIVRHFDLVPDTISGRPELSTENVWFVKTKDFNCKIRKIKA